MHNEIFTLYLAEESEKRGKNKEQNNNNVKEMFVFAEEEICTVIQKSNTTTHSI